MGWGMDHYRALIADKRPPLTPEAQEEQSKRDRREADNLKIKRRLPKVA